MTESENFRRARDNEADEKYLGTEWDRFHDFEVVEKTEDNVRVRAKWDDPLRNTRKGRDYPGEWLFNDYNARGTYAPLSDEPDLFVKFADLARKDPGTRDGREEIMLKWIREYGVLGLWPESNSGVQSRRLEDLRLFWLEVRRAAKCRMLYEAATGPGRVLKRSGLPGKTLPEKRKEAARLLIGEVRHTLERHCYPKLYYSVLEDTGELAVVELGWGFRSLLGAMYLQMAWRITSRRCEAPGCNNIIGLHKRSDMRTCSKACKERRRQHRLRASGV